MYYEVDGNVYLLTENELLIYDPSDKKFVPSICTTIEQVERLFDSKVYPISEKRAILLGVI